MKLFGLDTGPRMTAEQQRELERLRRQVKNNELTVNEARDIWDSEACLQAKERRRLHSLSLRGEM